LSTDARAVIDLGGEFADMLALIDAGEPGIARAEQARKAAQKSIALDAVKLLAPVPEPRQIRDFMCSEQHCRDASRGLGRLKARLAGTPLPEGAPPAPVPDIYARQPIYYLSNRFNVSGPDADIAWPRYTEYLDYELEVGFFIGRQGRNISETQAKDHIFGYTIFNDFSARDRQGIEMQGFLGPAKSKSFDTANAIGPWIVTPDEIGDVYNLDVEVRVNGESWGKNRTSGMFHTFEHTIAFVSEDETLHPGEFFGSGTIGGCCGLESNRWLKPGDVIELEVDRIGVLRNKIVRG